MTSGWRRWRGLRAALARGAAWGRTMFVPQSCGTAALCIALWPLCGGCSAMRILQSAADKRARVGCGMVRLEYVVRSARAEERLDAIRPRGWIVETAPRSRIDHIHRVQRS